MQHTTQVTQEQDYRCYISGLSQHVTTHDLSNRFSSFGKVSRVSISTDKNGITRGFGHFTLHTSINGYNKFLSTFQNTKWKESKLSIKPARPSYLDKLKLEWNTSLPQPLPKLSRKESKRLSTSAIHGDNMQPIKDSDPLRMGWKKGKYGRAVCVMNMKANMNARIKSIDPSKMQHQLKKFIYNHDEIIQQEKLEYVRTEQDDELEYANYNTLEQIETQNQLDNTLESRNQLELGSIEESIQQSPQLYPIHHSILEKEDDGFTLDLDGIMNALDDGPTDYPHIAIDYGPTDYAHIAIDKVLNVHPTLSPPSTPAISMIKNNQEFTNTIKAEKEEEQETDLELEKQKALSILSDLLRNEPLQAEEKYTKAERFENNRVFLSDDEDEEVLVDVDDESQDEAHGQLDSKIQVEDNTFNDQIMKDVSQNVDILKGNDQEDTEKIVDDSKLASQISSLDTLQTRTLQEDAKSATVPSITVHVNTNLRNLVFGETSKQQKTSFTLFSKTNTEEEHPRTLSFLEKPVVTLKQAYDPITDTQREQVLEFQKYNPFFITTFPKMYSFMKCQEEEEIAYEWDRNKKELTEEYKRKYKSASRKKEKSVVQFNVKK